MKAKTKQCGACRSTLPLSDFSKSKNAKNGHHGTCMNCRSNYGKETHKIHIGGLTFTQHADSIHSEYMAKTIGTTPHEPLYAFYGGIRLTSLDIAARCKMMAHQGIKLASTDHHRTIVQKLDTLHISTTAKQLRETMEIIIKKEVD